MTKESPFGVSLYNKHWVDEGSRVDLCSEREKDNKDSRNDFQHIIDMLQCIHFELLRCLLRKTYVLRLFHINCSGLSCFAEGNPRMNLFE